MTALRPSFPSIFLQALQAYGARGAQKDDVMSKMHKKMVLKDLSFNDIVALERELLWFTDQYLYQFSGHLGRTSSTSEKLKGWMDLAATATAHREMHQQILESIDALRKNRPQGLGDDDQELVLRLPYDIFDVVADGMNSDYLNLRSQDKEVSYWKNLSLPQVERRAFIRHHKTLCRALRDAEPLFVQAEPDELEAEDALPTSAEVIEPTMKAPAGFH